MNTKILNYLETRKFFLITMLSIIAGIFTGLIFQEKTNIILPLGKIFINLTFTVVTPLIFFSVSSSIANITSITSAKRTILNSVFVFLSMSLMASMFMMLALKIFPFMNNISIFNTDKQYVMEVSILDNVVSAFTKSNFAGLLSVNGILPLIIFSVFFGLSARYMGEKSSEVKRTLKNFEILTFKMIGFLKYYAPLGLFACLSYYFGNYSENFSFPLIRAIIGFYLCSIVFAIIFYTGYAYISAGMDGVRSLKHVFFPAANAFATNSSLATIPVNFLSADEMNIPKSVSNITLPFGGIVHLDGTSMATVLEVLLVSSLFGVDMSGFSNNIMLLLFAVLAPLVSYGIPGGGNLMLQSIMVKYFNLPLESFPILVVLHASIDAMISSLNAVGNLVGTMLITRLTKGEVWMLQQDIDYTTIADYVKNRKNNC